MAASDPELALEIQLRALADFVAVVANAAPDSRLVGLPGNVRGAVSPAAPERSIANAVTYRDGEALLRSLDELAAAYRAAGVRAWTVLAPERDRELGAALDQAGHALDAKPMAMLCDLAGLRPPDPGDLDWDAEGDLPLLGALNDEAYGHRGREGFAGALARAPADAPLRIYRARVDGEPACVLATLDHRPAPGSSGPDCGIYFVATPPRFRGRGLAGRLLGAALVEARERGCATSSLQATVAGEPIYRALGYEACFRVHMYERRART